MTTETQTSEREPSKKVIYRGRASDAVYGLGMIGAWVYYFTTATSFWIGVLGFFKGIAWPAFLVFELLKYLNM